MNLIDRIKAAPGWTAAIIIALALAFSLGYAIKGGGPKPETAVHAHGNEDDVLFWTCSMHPQVRQPGPGQCPICGMDLIPVHAGEEGAGGALGEREIKLSPYAQKLAEIEESPVVRMDVISDVRMAGKIEYDERKVGYITAWAPGRIDKLYVDFTGTLVNEGDPMVWLYSPELYSAQQELIEAWKAYRNLKDSGLESIRTTAWTTIEASREKLKLLGLGPAQIGRIEKRGRADDHVTINAPASGVVIAKNGFEGMYVSTGARIYTIADLSSVWTMMDAYESDLIWLREGQKVDLTAEAYPGETFKGKIEFIDPFLDEKTRTARVRVTIPNPEGRLKPGMFVHGVAMPTSEDVKRVAGELGGKGAYPLVIPDSAPLITGKRAVVYVADPQRDGVYEGREVVLGPHSGDHYVVKDGLSEGEMVVTNGNFKIDSAVQIMAKPSMMSPEGGAPPPGHHHGSGTMAMPEKADAPMGPEARADEGKTFSAPDQFKKQLDAALDDYFDIQQALAGDSLGQARAGAADLIKALEKVNMGLLEGHAHMAWMGQLETMNKSAREIYGAGGIKEARSWFQDLSAAMNESVHSFGISREQPVFLIHCPMAFEGKGADWLQEETEVENPYYGEAMLKCGERMETISFRDNKE